MFEHDSFFFIGVFVFIFFVWLLTGGPTHPLSFAGPLLAGPGPLGGGTYLSLPQAPGISGSGGVDQSHATGGNGNAFSGIGTLSGVSFGTPSNYRDEVTLSHYVSGAGGNPQNEYLQISVSANSAPVTLTGWVVESEASGNQITIPQGTKVPLSGLITPAEPIVLNPGDRALIISGRSPIGASFKVNKCIGYFAEFQSFYPSLPNSCPAPSDELNQFYGPNLIRDASCIDYVSRLNRCAVVLTPPTTLSSACQSFLTAHVNYNGCVASHQYDSDFSGTEWRIYLGSTVSLWRTQHELIKLVDASGKTVDMFTY